MSARLSKALVGLIGAGIQRSLTPAMHEEEARRQGLALHYQVIDLDAAGVGVEALPTLIEAARIMGFAGLNITYPCKQAVIPLLDELSDEARAMGAVNTVIFRGGRAVGHNTDGSGWAWGIPPQPAASRPEAGGAARCGRRRLGHRPRSVAPGRRTAGGRRPRGRACAGRGGPVEHPVRARPRRCQCRRGRGAARRHRADPRHAHRHGQAAGAAACGRAAAARTVGGRDRLLSARHRVAAGRARERLCHRGRRHDGRRPGGRRLRAVHRPLCGRGAGRSAFPAPGRANARRIDTEQERAMGAEREAIGELPNPLGLEGIEFIEYATTQPAGAGPGAGDAWASGRWRATARARCCCTGRAA